MRRRLLKIFSALLLVLCLSTVGLWARSEWVLDQFYCSRYQNKGNLTFWTIDDVRVGRGVLGFCRDVTSGPRATYRQQTRRVFDDYGIPQTFHQTGAPDFPWFGSQGAERQFAGVGWEYTTWSPSGDHSFQVRVPLAYLAMIFAVFPMLQGLRWYRRRAWAAAGYCTSCRYDLRASPDRCPECGSVPRWPATCVGSDPRRQLARPFAAIGVAGMFVAVALRYEPALWHMTHTRYMQRLCAEYTAPPGKIVFAIESWAPSVTSRVPPFWNDLTGSSLPGKAPDKVLFLHDRANASGHKTIAILLETESGDDGRTTIRFMSATVDGTSVSAPSPCVWDTSESAAYVEEPLGIALVFLAGQSDATDSSRFTLRFEADGAPGTIVGHLADDGRIHLRTIEGRDWSRSASFRINLPTDDSTGV